MPRGPKGEKRPADVIGNAVHVMRIATGEVEEITPERQGKEYARNGGAGRACNSLRDDALRRREGVTQGSRSIVRPFVMSHSVNLPTVELF